MYKRQGKVNALFAARAKNAHIPLARGVLFAGRLKAGRRIGHAVKHGGAAVAIGHTGGVVAVSYTHLDVYKRPQKGPGQAGAQPAPQAGHSAGRAAAAPRYDRAKPVSYTHLDVYKRQS